MTQRRSLIAFSSDSPCSGHRRSGYETAEIEEGKVFDPRFSANLKVKAHNPTVAGSNPAPAVFGNSGCSATRIPRVAES
jgi:hypothetical protein